MMMTPRDDTTHFGFQTVALGDKEKKVGEVFHSVAKNYDLMNDLMSFGVHRLWKQWAIEKSQVRPGDLVLDLAGGSGDLTRKLCEKVGASGHVVLADINASMLTCGRTRLMDEGWHDNLTFVQANAERLPFADNHFHCITMGFGLRNVTDKAAALRSMYRVCRAGGQLVILEFSTPVFKGLRLLYDWYSFQVIPKLGQMFAGDSSSYQYLAESIRVHPTQAALTALIEQSGFEDCRVHNLSGGIVALHIAYKY